MQNGKNEKSNIKPTLGEDMEQLKLSYIASGKCKLVQLYWNSPVFTKGEAMHTL